MAFDLDANKVAYHREKLPHIFTSVFMDNFVFIGGGGATIGLVLAIGYLAKRKIKQTIKNTGTYYSGSRFVQYQWANNVWCWIVL